MIQLHHLVMSRSNRIAWLLEELDLEYEVIRYERDPKTSAAPESLKAVHPLGKSPVITDGDLTIAESGAIVEYLIDTYDTQARLKPSGGQALLDYRFWLHFAEGSMMPLLVMRLVLDKSLTSPMPFFIRPVIKKFIAALNRYFIEPRLTPQLELVEDHLKQSDWLAGDALSGADIQMVLALVFAKTTTDFAPYPNINAYLHRVSLLDSYQAAEQRM
ncbi:glutathione S-transferase [Vibrio sp.]|uniref:glutathione transferase n=1 Tax=Vibrio viridaestus TaxID=2487322 RepID=A0A3N9TBY7_9VIBR|nr:glutathione S-transferase [Vibrio viridaestus]MDC0610079.1 glutathione S-transferase [Vibrio sp.]RQW61324.1 glutathione S-transferase [Vibrio viridaestus]